MERKHSESITQLESDRALDIECIVNNCDATNAKLDQCIRCRIESVRRECSAKVTSDYISITNKILCTFSFVFIIATAYVCGMLRDRMLDTKN